MLNNGSAEYYEIMCKDSLWNYLQRIRHGYMPIFEIIDENEIKEFNIAWIQYPNYL